MNPSSPEKPLFAGINTKLAELRPKKVFFFERQDGSIMYTDEKDAWAIYSGRNRVLGAVNNRPKLIGTGEGKIFSQAIQEAQELFKTSGLQASQDRIKKGVEDELQEARKTVVPPRNVDTVLGNGEPVNLASLR